MNRYLVAAAAFLICIFPSEAMAAPPANDDFVDAVTLIGSFATASGSTIDATRESGERSGTGFSTTWYKWTSPGTGRARFSALATDQNFQRARISVWFGTVFGDLVFVGAEEEFNSEALLLDLPVISGGTYYYCVGHYGDDFFNEGTYDCSIVLQTNSDLSSKPISSASGLNYLFDQATELNGTFDSSISYGFEAPAAESGEPVLNPNYSSWWKWVAPATGNATASLAGSEVGRYYDQFENKTLIIYEVNTFAEMILALPVGGFASQSGLPLDSTFPVVQGRTYYIAAGVGAYNPNLDLFQGGQDPSDLAWKILTIRYSAVPSPIPGQIASLRVQISKAKRAIKKLKKRGKGKKARNLRRRLSNLKKQLRQLS